RKEQVFQREEELEERERDLWTREARLKAAADTWDAGAVEAAEIERIQAEKQVAALREHNSVLRDEIQVLRKQLERVNEADYQRLQEDNAQLRQEISRLAA